MKNTNELKSFNLNRKFEFVSFLKFVSFNNNVTDYHLIQLHEEIFDEHTQQFHNHYCQCGNPKENY